MAVRSIVRIDEEKCTGCGLCVTPCAEGAIQIVDGKAKVLREELCDGAGFCLAVCPEGALTIERREAAAFDEEAAAQSASAHVEGISQTCFNCGRGEDNAVLFPCRYQGQSLWACA
ncbi:MAG: 4Fe-4S binding protein, partial [Actinobacteria bacterium]|nr:4Fe-4S binding protein [Actinomycetota bacterium]